MFVLEKGKLNNTIKTFIFSHWSPSRVSGQTPTLGFKVKYIINIICSKLSSEPLVKINQVRPTYMYSTLYTNYYNFYQNLPLMRNKKCDTQYNINR